MVKEKKVGMFEYGGVIDNFHIDAFFFSLMLVDRCRHFLIKRRERPPIFIRILCSDDRREREREKKNIRFARRMIQYARSLIAGSTRRMTDTKACKRYAVRARIGRTSWLPKQLWRYTWWWITACPGSLVRRLCFSFRLDRPLDSIARFQLISFVLFFFFFNYLTRALYLYGNE